ncbi:MAG: LysR family transcriptional regulator, partial [Psychrobacter sp.]|nr:LysR family transcriptional regulator [Psychrobacter sp.]
MAIDVVVNQRHLQIQLKQLETVWHTVINGYNLSQAATVLHTSQSSLSKHIAALENQLKTEVFVRQGKRLTGLTTMGTALMPHIESIFAEIRTIENLSLDFNNPNIGTLTIATTHTQARYVLPRVVKEFKDRFPKVNLILQQADPETIAQMVIRGQADIGIATESLLHNDYLRCYRYYDWTHRVIVPSDHELAGLESIDLPTLASYPIVTYHGGFTGRGAIDKTFSDAGLEPDIVLAALDA